MQPGPQGLIGLGQPAALRPHAQAKGVRIRNLTFGGLNLVLSGLNLILRR